MTALGTGIGMYDRERCARQMVLALKHFWDARSEEGQRLRADPPWMTDWDNILPIALQVTGEDEGTMEAHTHV